MSEWKDRIVGHGKKAASQFMVNPKNWRVHPQAQREALRGALNEIGWIAPVVENTRTGALVDGHERVWQALRNGDAEVPYVQVDLSEEEEAYALATLDPIGAMAEADRERLDELLSEVQSSEAGVQKMLAELAKEAGLYQEQDRTYTQKIKAPVYEITGNQPHISELYDYSRTKMLIEAIDAVW